MNIRLCSYCGEEFNVPQKKPKQQCCSRECASSKRREHLEPEIKQCIVCLETLSINMFEFFNITSLRRRKVCINCRTEQMTFIKIKSNYNLTREEYKQMVKQQNNLCAICNRAEHKARDGKTLRLCIDHNAETGQVRGLLCSNCNAAIGLLDHNTDLLAASINYLLKYEQDSSGGKLNGKI